jgi:protein-disulfide isomerase
MRTPTAAATVLVLALARSTSAQLIDVSGEPFKGSPGAKAALIVFSDYQCAYSAGFVRLGLPRLEADYLQTGKVRFVMRDLPLASHPHAFKAAEAAHCAGAQGKFWEMHDVLFRNQNALSPPQLTMHAIGLKLKPVPFQVCLNTGRFAAEIEKDRAEARSAGINATPTFLLGVAQDDGRVRVVKKLVGVEKYADLKAALDEVLRAAR